MKGWKKDIFNNFIKLNRGFDLPNHSIKIGNYPVVASTSVKAYHNAYKVKPPCVVTGRSGSLGSVQHVNEKCWPLNTTLYVKDYKGNLPTYVYYFLKTMHLENFNAGAGVPTLNQNHLHKLKISIPPLPIQKKIAAVLSAYDDLIENNNRRIAILEKMAEEIYREWFVRMRFPGHEKVKFHKGVPDGWEELKLGQFCSCKYGYTESATDDENLPKYLRVTDINKKSYIKWNAVPNCPINEINFDKYKLSKYDIVVARMADPGKIMIIEWNLSAVFASYLIKIEYNKDVFTPYYLFFTLRTDYYQGILTGANSGATRASINANIIKSLKIIKPPREVLENFDSKVCSIRDTIQLLLRKSSILSQSRDLLLSRLISGKLSVENLDIKFPPDMEETDA